MRKTHQLFFVDDRWDILAGLAVFYRQYPQLIPSNVCLHLYQYDGYEKPEFTYQIQGNGTTDLAFFASLNSLSTALKLEETLSLVTAIKQHPTLFEEWLENRALEQCPGTVISKTL